MGSSFYILRRFAAGGPRGVSSAIWACMALSACGAGTGTSANGGSSAATLSVSPGSLQITADAATSSTPVGTLNVTIDHGPTPGIYVGYGHASVAISKLSFSSSGPGQGVVTVSEKDPSVIGVGTYNDSVDVGLCTDSSCTAFQSGSVSSIPVVYNVTGGKAGESVTSSTYSVALRELPYLPSAPQVPIVLTFQNLPATSVTLSATFTSNGVATVVGAVSGVNTWSGNIILKIPTTLETGIYDDVITIAACNKSKCPTALAGAPISISVEYTISNTLLGTNGYSVRLIPAAANDIVSDPVGGLLYLSSPGRSTINPNSVVALDPVTGLLGAVAYAGTDPSLEAVSDDGGYLYVGLNGTGSVQRLKLPTLAPDLTIPMGSDAKGALLANDIQVAPGLAHTLAVTRGHSIGVGDAGVAIFDDAVARSATFSIVNGVAIDDAWVQWSTVNTLDGFGSNGALYTLGVSATGLSLVSAIPPAAAFRNGGRSHLEGGSLFLDSGHKIDPLTGALLGKYSVAASMWLSGVAPDTVHGRVFALVRDPSNNGVFLQAYDINSYAPIASVPLYGLNFAPNGPIRLVRWGADGLATITADGLVVLINGAIVL